MSKLPKLQERLKDIDAGLSMIFGGKAHRIEAEAMESFQPDRRLRWVWGLVAVVAVLFIVLAVWIGMLFFSPFRGFKGQGLVISVDGPARITIGQETTYFINYQNRAEEPLASAHIRVNFPKDFHVLSVDPPATDRTLEWRLGSLGYGARGVLTVHGTFTGSLGTQTAIQAFGSFRPASFNSDFEAVASRAIQYDDSVFQGSLNCPAKVLPGDHVVCIYHLEHQGSEALKGAQIRWHLPQGFVRDVKPGVSAQDGGEVETMLPDLSAGASTTVVLNGTFAAGRSGEIPFVVDFGRLDEQGAFLPLNTVDQSVFVLGGDVSLKLVVNGTDQSSSIGLGETAHLSFAFENTASEAVQGLQLRLLVTPVGTAGAVTSSTSFIDWSRADDSASGTKRVGSFVWTKNELRLLGELAPGQDGVIDVTLPIVSTVTSTTPQRLQLVAEATMDAVGKTKIHRTIRSAPLELRLRSDARVNAEARYFNEEGIPMGSGPLPPIVGQTTRYVLNWDVQKSLHELQRMSLTAQLPKRAAWVNRATASAGEIQYDPDTRTVRWTLNRLPADLGTIHAQFEVDFTPSDLDAGRFGTLLEETDAQFFDQDIQEMISKSLPPITTDLQADEGAKGKGVVKK